jgi:hypothetical protein
MSSDVLPLPLQASTETRLQDLGCSAFYLGLALHAWDREGTWQNLRIMAEFAGLHACECPTFRSSFPAVYELFGQLAKAIEAGDYLETRDVLAAMLRQAGLAA